MQRKVQPGGGGRFSSRGGETRSRKCHSQSHARSQQQAASDGGAIPAGQHQQHGLQAIVPAMRRAADILRVARDHD